MAEIEFSVSNPDETPCSEPYGNASKATINWRFNTQDARTKLHRLYPFNSNID